MKPNQSRVRRLGFRTPSEARHVEAKSATRPYRVTGGSSLNHFSGEFAPSIGIVEKFSMDRIREGTKSCKSTIIADSVEES